MIPWCCLVLHSDEYLFYCNPWCCSIHDAFDVTSLIHDYCLMMLNKSSIDPQCWFSPCPVILFWSDVLHYTLPQKKVYSPSDVLMLWCFLMSWCPAPFTMYANVWWTTQWCPLFPDLTDDYSMMTAPLFSTTIRSWPPTCETGSTMLMGSTI